MESTASSRGRIRKPSDSHASWSAHKLADGWNYGPLKDPKIKEHPCLVPFAELPAEQQQKDILFFNTVVGLSVLSSETHWFVRQANAVRSSIKKVAEQLEGFSQDVSDGDKSEGLVPMKGEIIANLRLGYRHLEDASMRLGKAIQAYDGGVSVYDRETTVGA
jgi:hypothetical protein